MKITRREFLKRLALIGGISITGISLELLRENIDEFSVNQLKAVQEIDKIEVQRYHPYFVVGPDDEDYEEYVITKTDGTREYYTDIRPLKRKYGNLIDYWNESMDDNLPDDLYSSRYDGDGWLL